MSLITKQELRGQNNKRYTQSMFIEYGGKHFTLADEDKDGVPALRQLFVALVVHDPTEFEFAEAVFGDYAFWENLSGKPFMQPYLEEWRKEADAKRKSLAFKAIIKEAQEGRNPMQAAKYLVEEPWKVKGTAEDKRKARAKSRETTKMAVENKEFKEDLERIRERLN